MKSQNKRDTEENFKTKFGERFKILRKSLKLNQEDFAKHIGVSSVSFISNIEKGQKIPGSEILFILKSKNPTLNLNWLLSGEGEMLLSEIEATNNSADQRIANLENAVATIQRVISSLQQE